ncbi:MAG TPA: hypothetical protein VIK37_03180 [Candidatus Saccharimonadales bacterium]
MFVLITVTNKSPLEEPDPDRVDISISNTAELRSILLTQQYYTVVNTLADYIQSTINPKVKRVEIVGVPTIAMNGNISLTLKIRQPDKQLTVEIDRSTYFDKIILKIPQDKYEATIPVYTSL